MSVFKSNTDEIYRNIFLKKRDIVSIVPEAHRKHCIYKTAQNKCVLYIQNRFYLVSFGDMLGDYARLIL